MSDLRLDPITNQWVSIAGNRLGRPMEFVAADHARQQITCAFCKGNENETPPTTIAYHANGSLLNSGDDPSQWITRVVPNRYPSFSEYESSGSTAHFEAKNLPNDAPFQSNQSPGLQELIIPSPRHVTSLSELTDEELHVAFLAFQQRVAHVESIDYIKHAMLFMNCRSAAGASLGHLHWQLIGSPVTGEMLVSRENRNQLHFETNQRSMLETMLEWEVKQETRIVSQTNNFYAICPYASRFAYQVWIVSRSSDFDFLTCGESERNELGELCQKMVTRFETLQDETSYNILLHRPPVLQESQGDRCPANRQTYIEMFPRITRPAGFEWGTDIWINPVAPETAAKHLRAE